MGRVLGYFGERDPKPELFSEKSAERKKREREREREPDASSQWHLQGMKLLPKSPLDSSHLGRGTGRGRGWFQESDPKPKLFS
jgi:hypothetical protein